MAESTTKDLAGELIPPEGDPKAGYKVFEILKEILDDKDARGLPERWQQYYELARNKHWKRASKNVNLVSVNLMHAHITRTVNLLTDNNPTFDITEMGSPEEDQKGTFDMLLRTARHWWTDTEQQHILEKSVKLGEINGCTIEKVIFNPAAEFGFGEAETINVDPHNFGVYPVDADSIDKAEAVLHFVAMTVREVRRQYPAFAADIVPDKEYLDKLGAERKEVSGGRPGQPQGYFTTFGSTVKNILGLNSGAKSESDKVLMVECWVKDYTIGPDGQFKYPGAIRSIKTVNGGKIVLEDVPNPSINPVLDPEQAKKTYLYDKFPYSWTPSVTDPVNAWGQSDFEQLENLQLEFDKTISQFTLFKSRASRLLIKNPKTSGVANSEFTNAHSIINPASASESAAIGYMNPPPIPSDLIEALKIYKDFFFLVAGTFELENAQTPGRDVIAYKAIAALIEHAATILRGKIRNYSRMIRLRGRMYLSHVMNWYDTERTISWEDEEGNKQSGTIVGQKMIVPAKLTVVSGSTMPVSKVQEREEAIELHRGGAIDSEELLKRLEWPDRKNVLRRMAMGPYGALMDRLVALGLPPKMAQQFTEIGMTEDKDFERGVKEGKIPDIRSMLGALMGEQTGQSPPITDMAEVALKQAQMAKVNAETELTKEKVITERVDQWVKAEGVAIDKETLKIQRAQFVNELDKQIAMADEVPPAAAGKKKPTAQGPYREKGKVSNNRTTGEGR